MYFSRCLIFLVSVMLNYTALSAEKVDAPAPIANPVPTKKVRNDRGLKNNDGADYNKKHGILLHLGPGAAQNGQPNPVGVPPSLLDIEATYLNPTGLEVNVGVVPGITGGVRYRTGGFLYGSAGAGIIFSAAGIGPGVYTALGMSVMRQWPVTLEFEIKQAIGIAMGMGPTRITTPYAIRFGAGYYF